MNRAVNLRIIVIDDDPSMRTMLKIVFTKLGYDVLTFADPTECPAVKKIDCLCPQKFPCADILIADMMMPKMTGIEFFQLQKKRGCKALDLNKALMSAASTFAQREAVLELGCHFIKKPFKIADIVRWVEGCAERIPADRELAKLA